MENRDLMSQQQVVVLMGGKGTRLGLKDIPKALANVNGIPFFDYQLKILKRWGFRKFLFLVGYQAEKIMNYYKDGSSRGIEIEYSSDEANPRGTGGALAQAIDLLEDEFLLLYGDSFMDIDYQELVYRFEKCKVYGKQGVMTLLHNYGQYDKSNVIYKDKKLLLYDKNNVDEKMEYIDYGVMMLSKNILAGWKEKDAFDLSEVLKDLSIQNKLAGQIVNKRFYEIGRPETYREFCEYVKKRFDVPKKAIFFDRDGVINELVFCDETEQLDSPFCPEHIIYKNGILDVLRYLIKKDYYLFIVTNQPAAAKGKVSIEQIYDVNSWIVDDLRKQGISIEFSNVCPHHPTGTKYTKQKSLVKNCGCRKPKNGLLTDLKEIYNINWEESYMVGDSYTDIIAGHSAGLKTILFGQMKCDLCQRLQEYRPNYVITKINELINIIDNS